MLDVLILDSIFSWSLPLLGNWGSSPSIHELPLKGIDGPWTEVKWILGEGLEIENAAPRSHTGATSLPGQGAWGAHRQEPCDGATVPKVLSAMPRWMLPR